MAASVSQEQAFDDIEFIVFALLETIGHGLVLRPTKDFQQLVIAAFANSTTQLAYLLHCPGQDLKLDGIFRRMLYERVAGLKFELAGQLTDSNSDTPAKSSARPKDRVQRRRHLQSWFD